MHANKHQFGEAITPRAQRNAFRRRDARQQSRFATALGYRRDFVGFSLSRGKQQPTEMGRRLLHVLAQENSELSNEGEPEPDTY